MKWWPSRADHRNGYAAHPDREHRHQELDEMEQWRRLTDRRLRRLEAAVDAIGHRPPDGREDT